MTPSPQKIRLRPVAAGRGAVWVRQGFAVFFARPLAFTGLLALLLFCMLLTRLLPMVGPFLFDASLPLMSLGFMLAAQDTLQGRSPSPGVFVRPLRVDRQRRVELLKLGALYAIGVFAAMLAAHWIDGGKMAALRVEMMDDEFAMEALQARLNDPQLMSGMIWRVALTALVSLLFWHTGALVHWGGQTAAKALFFNAVALWRTKGAFAVYALVGVGLAFGFTLIGTLLLALSGQPQQLAGPLFMPGMLMFAAVFYASLFFTFADSFELSVNGDSASSS